MWDRALYLSIGIITAALSPPVCLLPLLSGGLPPEPPASLPRPSILLQVRQTIVEDFGQPPEQLFASFSAQPIASASLAQVRPAGGKCSPSTRRLNKGQRYGC